jgi:2-keto-3-deoxy-L-rhamnonate aldolase RhmA
MADPAAFRQRLSSGASLIGTFLKTPTTHATEILGEAGFDFVVVDAEHAPFDRGDIDMIALAGRAAEIAVLVRVQKADPSEILSALDCGATGILVPHVADAATAREIVAAANYANGSRGFSNSPRAGNFGRLGFQEHITRADAEVTVLAMIEDPEAVDDLESIFAVEGIAGAFIGRGDLSAKLGTDSPDAPEIRALVERIAQAAKRHKMPLLAHVGTIDAQDAEWLREQGVTAFIVASDQGFMRQAALANLTKLRNG